jgi:hypothetical protein
MNQETQNSQINNILTQCWEDESFKQKLLADSELEAVAGGKNVPSPGLFGQGGHGIHNMHLTLSEISPRIFKK